MRLSLPSVRITTGLVLLVGALVGASVTRARAQYAVFDADAALRVFHERVESYAALHRRLAPPPAAITSTDPIGKLLTRNYLAAAVRGARRSSAAGRNLHTGDRHVVPLDAGRLDRRARRRNVPRRAEWRRADAAWHAPDGQRAVHDDAALPRPAGGAAWAADDSAELDYRIAAHDLVLWDIYAGIVVDFVPDALTSRVATE